MAHIVRAFDPPIAALVLGPKYAATVTAVVVDFADGTVVVVAIVGTIVPSRAAKSPADVGSPEDADVGSPEYTDHGPIRGLSHHANTSSSSSTSWLR